MTLNVIDVSEYNGNIDWKRVKGSIDAAIIRAGYRGYGSAGILVTDKKFAINAEGANAQGIPIGVYWLSQALNEAEAREEAMYLVNLLKPYDIDFPVYLDSEYCKQDGNGRGDRIGKDQRTKNTLAFLAAIKAAGYKAGLYCAESWFSDEIDGTAVRNAGYTIWCARLAGKPRIGDHDAWQYSWKGSVNGISGDVDLNYFYTDFSGNIDITKPTEKPSTTSTGATYTVKKGDTLSAIAKKYGTTYAVLAAYNGIENPNLIYVGQVIKIPKSVTEIAKEVISGVWGDGAERKNRLTEAGYNYSEVQKEVNKLLK